MYQNNPLNNSNPHDQTANGLDNMGGYDENQPYDYDDNQPYDYYQDSYEDPQDEYYQEPQGEYYHQPSYSYRQNQTDTDYYLEDGPGYYQEDPYQSLNQVPAGEVDAVTTARQQRMKLVGIIVVVLIVLVTVLVKTAGPKQAPKSGDQVQLKSETPRETFQDFNFQIPDGWKVLDLAKPEEADFTRSYVPKNASKGEVFTIYTPGPSQQNQAALEKLSEEEILTSYLEAVQQDSQIHDFSPLQDSYPLGLAHRSYSYKFSQAPDLAYVVNTVVLKEGQLFVFQTAAEEGDQAWVETAHAEILQSLKLQ